LISKDNTHVFGVVESDGRRTMPLLTDIGQFGFSRHISTEETRNPQTKTTLCLL